jgi:hypothetical protein
MSNTILITDADGNAYTVLQPMENGKWFYTRCKDGDIIFLGKFQLSEPPSEGGRAMSKAVNLPELFARSRRIEEGPFLKSEVALQAFNALPAIETAVEELKALDRECRAQANITYSSPKEQALFAVSYALRAILAKLGVTP